jgi:hypothetical protein
MLKEQIQIKVFIKTTKQVIKELEEIKEVEIANFKNAVKKAFVDYNIDGIEDLVGFDDWNNLIDGNYQLNLKIDHENAYEFTIHTIIKNTKATIVNVL